MRREERIERRIQSLILHIPQIEHARLVEAVKRLYLDRLRVGARVVSEPLLPRAELSRVLGARYVPPSAEEYCTGSWS